jgi:uncharacterized protein involved in response to NO
MSGERSARSFSPFALGFRPFFLAAAAAALLLMVAWLGIYTGALGAGGYFPPVGWHAHEMLFGYTVAVVAGFLLTAVRNWTDIETPAGTPLLLLALLWLAGRLLPWLGPQLPAWVIALVDLLFLPSLAVAIGRPILRSGQRHNLVFLALLALLTLANLAMHLAVQGLWAGGYRFGIDLTIGLLMLLIVLVGGRVMPFFIERGLAERGERVRVWPWVERLAVATLVAWLGAQLVAPGSLLSGVLAGAAGVVHLVRLAGWHTAGLWRVPLLWVLWLGFAWLVLGFFLSAAAAFGAAAPSLALHAYTAGAIGVLTLGMMARVALGHTGRPMRAASVIAVAFALINLAALVRVVLPLALPGAYLGLIHGAGTLWGVAFLLYLVVYAPMLLRPRVDGQPG